MHACLSWLCQVDSVELNDSSLQSVGSIELIFVLQTGAETQYKSVGSIELIIETERTLTLTRKHTCFTCQWCTLLYTIFPTNSYAYCLMWFYWLDKLVSSQPPFPAVGHLYCSWSCCRRMTNTRHDEIEKRNHWKIGVRKLLTRTEGYFLESFGCGWKLLSNYWVGRLLLTG